jgi:hypothetical protein
MVIGIGTLFPPKTNVIDTSTVAGTCGTGTALITIFVVPEPSPTIVGNWQFALGAPRLY